jgi:hypothetical protein
MFAKDKKEASKISCELYQDQHIGSQGVVFRKYIPLKTYEIGINDLPFANEWRVFCLGKKILSHGYYWSSASDETIQQAKWTQDSEKLVKILMNIISKHVNFYVLDIAETESGEWILIEINDGQMSGLSENNPDVLYKNLKESLS